MALDVMQGPIVFWGLASSHFVIVWVPDIWRHDQPVPPARFYAVEPREGPPGTWAAGIQLLLILEHTVRRALESRRIYHVPPDRVPPVRACVAKLVPEASSSS